MKNHIYYCTLRQVYTYSHCCRLCTCSLRVGLTVFIPESDTGAVLMIIVVDLYHDVCVSVSSRWLLISGFSRSHCPRLSQGNPVDAKEKNIYVLSKETSIYQGLDVNEFLGRVSP